MLSSPLQRLSQACRSACPVRSHVQRALEPLAKSHRSFEHPHQLGSQCSLQLPKSSTVIDVFGFWRGAFLSDPLPCGRCVKACPVSSARQAGHGSSPGVSKNRLSTDMAARCPVPLISEELSFGTPLPGRCAFRPRRFHDLDGLLQRAVLLPCRAAAGPEVHSVQLVGSFFSSRPALTWLRPDAARAACPGVKRSLRCRSAPPSRVFPSVLATTTSPPQLPFTLLPAYPSLLTRLQNAQTSPGVGAATRS